MAITGLGVMAGIGAAKALLPGGQVSVPGSIAAPTDPTSKFVDETGRMKDEFRIGGLTNDALTQGQGLLGNLRDRATAVGPSQSAQYLQGASQLQGDAQRDQLANQNASNRATSEANMAMKGGLGSGSRERMAASGNVANMNANQNINQQQALSNMNILANDENQKLGLLQNLPGQYQSFGNEQMNRQVADTQGGMGLLMDKYGKDQQAYAANQMARQQAQGYNASNKGLLGGLI